MSAAFVVMPAPTYPPAKNALPPTVVEQSWERPTARLAVLHWAWAGVVRTRKKGKRGRQVRSFIADSRRACGDRA